MNLENIIKEYSNSKIWVDRYFSSGVTGKVLYSNCFSTNLRSLDTLLKQILGIKQDIGKPRNEWRRHHKHNQEISKQYVVPLLSCEAIYKDSEGLYQFTAKSKMMSQLMEENKFTKSEKELLLALFSLNYETIEHNSLISEYHEFIKILNDNGVSKEDIYAFSIEVINNRGNSSMFINRLFLYMVFFREVEYSTENNLLKTLVSLSDEEIQEFYTYIKKDMAEETYENFISQRLKAGGNLTHNTIRNMTLLNIIFYIVSLDIDNYEQLVDKIIGLDLYNVNGTKVKAFLMDPKTIDIFAKVLGDVGVVINVKVTKNVESLVDPSSMYNVRENNTLFDSAKPVILEMNYYKCALENIRKCDMNYFTSRSTGHNYLEVHHFLPRKYSNYIANGVEFMDNYIPLCPNCHRILHSATDNERRALLFYILENNYKVKEVLEKSDNLPSMDVREKVLAIYDFQDYKLGGAQ